MSPPGRRLLAAAVVAGVALRLLAVFAVDVFPTVANTWDSNFYHETAASLSRGDGYSFQGKPTAFYPPAFPAALAVAYRVAVPGPRTGQLMNVLFSCVLAVLVARWAGESFGSGAGRWALLLAFLDPSQILMPAFLMSEVLCALLLLVTVVGAWRGARGRWGWLALGALAGAAGGLTRGHVFLLLPVVPLVAALRGGLPRPRAALLLAVLLAVSAATVGAWAARNHERMGRAVPVATNAGINLLLGNNENAWGGRADPPGGVPQTGNEIIDERIATDRALDFLRDHPGRALAMLPLKAARLWAFGPSVTYRGELAAKIDPWFARGAAGAAQLAHLAVLVLAFLGLLRCLRAGGHAGLVALSIAVLLGVWTLGHLPFLGGARYLFPVYPLLLGAASARLAPPPEDARA